MPASSYLCRRGNSPLKNAVVAFFNLTNREAREHRIHADAQAVEFFNRLRSSRGIQTSRQFIARGFLSVPYEEPLAVQAQRIPGLSGQSL